MSLASIRPIPLADPVIRTFFPLRWTTFRRRRRHAMHKTTTTARSHSAGTIWLINYDVVGMTTQSKCPPIRLRDFIFFVFSRNEWKWTIQRVSTRYGTIAHFLYLLYHGWCHVLERGPTILERSFCISAVYSLTYSIIEMVVFVIFVGILFSVSLSLSVDEVEARFGVSFLKEERS